MIPEATNNNDIRYKTHLLTRIDMLQLENGELKDTLCRKRKYIEELEIKNILLKGIADKSISCENAKKKKKIDIVPVLIPPKNYKHLTQTLMNQKLIKLFCELNTIKDIINIENNPNKYDFIKNEKFNKLYAIIPELKKLNNMIGMENIKNEVFEHICYFLQNLNNNNEMMHIVITGPPGVGKTEVGRIIGGIYLCLGFLTTDTFIIAKRSDLIAEYLGQTAVKTQKVINSAQGGVLFIDEVYSLGNDELRDSFSKECIDTLNQNLTENKGKFLCIIAGYKKNIDKCFFAYNDGLQRRFPIRYNLESYNAEELTDIFLKKINDDEWKLNVKKDEVLELFKKHIDKFLYFGGDIELLLQKCKFVASIRAMKTLLTSNFDKKILMNDLLKAIDGVILSREYDKNKEPEPPYGMYT